MGQVSNKTIMAHNIAKYLKLKGIKPAELARVLGVPYTTVYDWVNGRTYPRIDKIQAMAEFFGIDKAELIEDHPQFVLVKQQNIQKVLNSIQLEGDSGKNLDELIEVIQAYRKADDKTKLMVRMLLDLEDDHG